MLQPRNYPYHFKLVDMKYHMTVEIPPKNYSMGDPSKVKWRRIIHPTVIVTLQNNEELRENHSLQGLP